MKNTEKPPGVTPVNKYPAPVSEGTIMFAKCIGCPDMGPSCLGPNLLMLPIDDLREWVKLWKAHYRLSIETCAKIWNVPAGTLSRFLQENNDPKYTTIWAIVQGIVQYGYPADMELGDNPCPASSSEIRAREEAYEQRIAELRAECDQLRRDGGSRDQSYIERMAEQRANYEQHLQSREKSVDFLRELSEKRQRDLEKERAVSANFLGRIDEKNRLLEERTAEIRMLNEKLLSIYGENAAETKALVDQMLRMMTDHAAEVRALNARILELTGNG